MINEIKKQKINKYESFSLAVVRRCISQSFAQRGGAFLGDHIDFFSNFILPIFEQYLERSQSESWNACLLYTSDAADDMQCVDLGGRRIIKKGRDCRLA